MGSSSITWAGISNQTILETLAVREALALADDFNAKKDYGFVGLSSGSQRLERQTQEMPMKL